MTRQKVGEAQVQKLLVTPTPMTPPVPPLTTPNPKKILSFPLIKAISLISSCFLSARVTLRRWELQVPSVCRRSVQAYDKKCMAATGYNPHPPPHPASQQLLQLRAELLRSGSARIREVPVGFSSHSSILVTEGTLCFHTNLSFTVNNLQLSQTALATKKMLTLFCVQVQTIKITKKNDKMIKWILWEPN